MSIQTSVRDKMVPLFAGQIAENSMKKSRGYMNSLPQRDNVTADAADTSTTVTVNGTAYNYAVQEVTISAANAETVATVNGTAYTANSGGGTATKAEIASRRVLEANLEAFPVI